MKRIAGWRAWLWRLLAFTAISLVGCGTDVAGPIGADVPDSVVPDVQPEFVPPPEDVGPELDLGHLDLPEDLGDIGNPWGDWNKPCASNEDCESGYCIQVSEDESVCTIPCVEECPKDWLCKGVQRGGPDLVFLCVPPWSNLCKACASDQDCVYKGDRCVQVGESGTFCLPDCSAGQPCSPHYACTEVTVGDETEASLLCTPETGSCVCTFELDGSSEECSVENEFGKCYGEKSCDGALGWTECDAPVPAAESCNGLDDDCDGQSDEGLEPEPCVIENEFGSCPGTAVCQGESGWFCEGEAPAAESCDGLDNDCDGEVDEEFPDYDADGQANCVDEDDDNDGTLDEWDCAPEDPAIHPDAEEICDGVDNNCNLFVDEGFPDADGDDLADCADPDDDNDGDPDENDCAPYDPEVGHGLEEICDGKDNNCNGETDEGFPDSDTDGIADCVDLDSDGDGIPNNVDNCPDVPNPGQVNSDNDALGDACENDDDNDGVLDEDDNCPIVPNQTQADLDQDGLGDACDPDADGDGHDNELDCAPLDPAIYPGAEELCNGIDDNCNGMVDEGFVDLDGDNQADCVDPDDDGDGDPDETDCAPQDPTIHAGADELCNGIDDNCNGQGDEGCPASGVTFQQIEARVFGESGDFRVDAVFGRPAVRVLSSEESGYKLHLGVAR